MLRCTRWTPEREELSKVFGVPLSPKNMTDKMTAGEAQRKAMESLVQEIISAKALGLGPVAPARTRQGPKVTPWKVA